MLLATKYSNRVSEAHRLFPLKHRGLLSTPQNSHNSCTTSSNQTVHPLSTTHSKCYTLVAYHSSLVYIYMHVSSSYAPITILCCVHALTAARNSSSILIQKLFARQDTTLTPIHP